MAFTKEQIGRMTSDEYKQNIGDERAAPLTEEQKAFRALVDGPSTESNRPAPRNTSNSPRGRAEAATIPVEVKTFDPSFDDSPNAPAVPAIVEAVVPAVEPVAAIVPPVELPEKIHEYQILDKQGRPRGGIQRFKYHTDAELIEHLTKAHKAASGRIWELMEEKVMSGTEAPADATVAGKLELRPTLTDEERAAWEEKRQDPATEVQSQYILDRDDDRRATNDLVHQSFENKVMLALQVFMNRNRDYVQSQDNATKLVSYIDRRGLDPTDAKNYQRAYDVLCESGVIAITNQSAVPELVTEIPTVREVKTVLNTQAPAEATARISPEVPPQEKRPVAQIPTGLSNADTISEGETTAKSILDAYEFRNVLKDGAGKPTGVVETFKREKAYQAMTSDIFKRLLEENTRMIRISGHGNGFPEWCDACEAKIAEDRAALRRRR